MVDDQERSTAKGSMAGHDPRVTTATNYRRFAQTQARDRSPAYADLAEAVTADGSILGFLEELPTEKRQPNLLFAAARYLLGVPADPTTLHELVARRGEELAAVMRERRTQTNEAARCATLLPALATLPQPLALLEVGASAGLTLLPDRYSYDYGGQVIAGPDPQAPTLVCQPRGPVPVPDRLPAVAWRAGIDLNPLDPSSEEDARWLECLLWPGEGDRAARLRGALSVARGQRPAITRGDLLDDLSQVAADAPRDATLVVYHSAVLAYVDPAKRDRFAAAVRALGAVWLSNEAPGVVSGAAPAANGPRGSFALMRDGRELLAFTDPHGEWLEWLH